MKLNITKSLLTLVIIGATSVFAQDVSGYEKVYYNNPENQSNDQCELAISNVVATFEYSKLSLKIINNSSDFLFYDSKETTFKFGFGEKQPIVKPFYIKPGGSKTKTLSVNGGDKFLQQKYSVDITGLYHIPIEGESAPAENFKLPASSNSMTAGNFKVVLKKFDASTKEAKAVFECTYTGNKVAVVNGSNLSVSATRKKSNEEVVYANDNKKSKPQILNPGDKVKVTAVFHIPGKIVDMQFATMYILWNNTFVETEAIPMDGFVFNLDMNEALTQERK
jgi:hypothetical protein